MGSLWKTFKMSTLNLFGSSVCPLSQSVQMTLDLLKLDYKYTEVNVDDGGTSTHDLLALNPHKSVPVLVDSNLVITESSAAITYLVNQYSPSQLYPLCAKKKSQIDQRLQFNIGRFYMALNECIQPVYMGETSTIETEKLDELKEVLMWINQMTVGGYVLDNSITIADIAFLSTMSALEACDILSFYPYKNINMWHKNMRKLVPNYENNCQKGADELGKRFRDKYEKSMTDKKEDNANDQDFKVDVSSETSSMVFTSESESGTDYTFSASDDGSYTPASNTDQLSGKGNVGAALARQMMMVAAPAVGTIPFFNH